MLRSISLASTISIIAAVSFAVIVVWMHVTRRDVRPAVSGVSHYAVGSTRTIMTAAFLMLAFALVLAAVAAGHPSPAGVTWGTSLLIVAALGTVTVALVPVARPNDATWRAPVHSAGALILFVASAAGSVAVSAGRGAPLTAISWVQVVTLIGFLAGMGGVPGLFQVRGWLQRAVFASLVLWLIAAAVRNSI